MIGYHLVRLAKFSGRETRAAFWPWAAVVVGLVLLGGVAAMTPQVLASMAKMRKFALEHPDQATITSGPGHYEISIEGHHPELMPDMGPFVLALEGTMAVLIVLIAAAAVRRLHDTGRSGAWALLPLPFLFFGFSRMPVLFADPVFDTRLFGLLFLNNLCYLAALGALILLLARSGKPGENRFGPEPRG
ncbi:uncharacterized protein DUF805 [Novosphingobium sp. PhB57]|jgi:uncharacterized membrane protein YhaH (DUF805 family)|uniref:DUF805 domain-containing protein n=1 Tax=unclassified Novosphingobium TaxID=2644732 RepID=UPI00104AC317|nr:DUF805 domain-containing protein [Novosphingobium sp. PhB57]TCU61072.1 uncharacterized protein DUF805 [Novosphingobium sp. PhB57]